MSSSDGLACDGLASAAGDDTGGDRHSGRGDADVYIHRWAGVGGPGVACGAADVS